MAAPVHGLGNTGPTVKAGGPVAHLAFERNRPATFTHPWMSFVSDWKMLWVFVTGRLGRELEKAGIAR